MQNPAPRIPVSLSGRSHNTLPPNGNAWTVTVWWGRGHVGTLHVETFHADTRPEAACLNESFSADRLVGFVMGQKL